MASLFGGGSAPQPQPVPVQPMDDSAAIAARQAAADAALADSKARGRASTIAAGGDQASTDQMQRGLLKSQKRTSASTVGLLGA